MNFSDIKVQADACAAAVQKQQAKIADLATVAAAVGDELDLLPTTFGALIADVDAAAVGSEDMAILTAKAELDLLVTEFSAARAKIMSVLSALA